MTRFFPCSYLGADIELTDEREQHIIQTHPGTLPEYLEQLSLTLADPGLIRQSEMKMLYYSPNGLIRSEQEDTSL